MDVPMAQLNSNLNKMYIGNRGCGRSSPWCLLFVLALKICREAHERIGSRWRHKPRRGISRHGRVVASRDEIGRTSESFNAMFDRVSEVVQSVKSAVSGITTGTTEISQGNEDLSQRTSAQAGALGRNQCVDGGDDLDHQTECR